MKKLALAVIATLALAAGCRAQVPPATQHAANLTWTAAAAGGGWAGCTVQAPCVYAIYRCTASPSACGDTTNAAWGELTNSTNRVSGTSYTDNTASGTTAYYNVETYQGSAHSGPSNTAGPLVVPGTPNAPQLGAGSVAQNNTPKLAPVPQGTKELASVSNLRAQLK